MHDEDLLDVRKFKSGDKRSFEILCRKHIDEIYNFFYKNTSSHEDKEELTQETFMRSFQNIQNFKEASTFRTWLFGIARYVLMEYYRGQSQKITLKSTKEKLKITTISTDQTTLAGEEEEPILELESTSPTPEQELEEREGKEELFKAINILSADQQKIIILRLGLQGETLSVKETATRLNKTEGAVKMDFVRALDTLRNVLTSKKRRFADFKFVLRR